MKIRSNRLPESSHVRQQVAAVLLQYARTDGAGKTGLSQREMATMLGTTWEMVNKSLTSLGKEGAIHIERHRMTVNQEALARIAVGTPDARAYVLLRTRNGDLEEATDIIRRQPGVVMADQIEGPSDVIFAVQACDRESLATLMIRAIAAVEEMTEEIQLLPAR